MNSVFSEKLVTLAEDANKLDYETGYLLYSSEAKGFNYEKMVGNSGELGIVFNPKGQIDGMVHNHNGNLFPNFSGADIKAIYDAYCFEKINDHQKFISVMVSGSGVSYLLKISDIVKFLAFAKENFVDRKNFIAFEAKYHNIQKARERTLGLNQSFESALLEMIETSGLVLYKSNFPFQSWIKLERDEGGVTQVISCF